MYLKITLRALHALRAIKGSGVAGQETIADMYFQNSFPRAIEVLEKHDLHSLYVCILTRRWDFYGHSMDYYRSTTDASVASMRHISGNQYVGWGEGLTISFITQGFFVPINKVHFL